MPVCPCEAISLGQSRGLGRDALGLSHLTYQTTRTVFLHQLDQPPFPCAVNLFCNPPHVKRSFTNIKTSAPSHSQTCTSSSGFSGLLGPQWPALAKPQKSGAPSFSSLFRKGWETSAPSSPMTRAFLVPFPQSLSPLVPDPKSPKKIEPRFADNIRPPAHNRNIGCLHPKTRPSGSKIRKNPQEMQNRTETPVT